ncbi:uracil-DNA glycosylase [Methylophilaceae bacterium]|jgi:uracil-DNA glycosylase|nr:uracil-DNA glycosylase [Methylophilaceae bacterium]|tara:strand:- start:910 stop:1539 length:630 start_codon:yes stop_codon:yes gene_type:complete
MEYDASCKDCKRLSFFLAQVKNRNPDYFCKPVPSFGQKNPPFLIVGLAPGMHGANKTGRPFTGDHAGILLYKTLYKFGFSNLETSKSVDDNLILKNCAITNAVKCLPPDNKPNHQEINNCNKFLQSEISELKQGSILLALGLIAHNAIMTTLNLTKKEYKFSHGARHNLPNNLVMYDSYHCSRYNTQTKRLTEEMFHEVFLSIKTEMER